MDPLRFIPRLEVCEERETPAALTPEMVFNAEALANFYFEGTRGALMDQTFIARTANRAPTQAVAATIIAQTPALTQVLNDYVAELRTEAAAAGPAYADWFNNLIERFSTAATHAQLGATQAQAVSNRINQMNASDAASGANGGGTGTGTGTNNGGVTQIPGIGTSNGTPTGIGAGGNQGSTTGTGSGTNPGTIPTSPSTTPTSGGTTGTTPGTTSGTTPGTTTTQSATNDGTMPFNGTGTTA